VSRRDVEERVARLAAEYSGAALVQAIRQLADELPEAERGVLAEVLLERADEQEAERYAEMTDRMRGARWRVVLPPKRPSEPL
jgi:hypothetical protein